MQFELEGRCAFVTGAQQGIGRATALALAKAGADVCINWLDDRAAAEGLAAEVKTLGRKAPLAGERGDERRGGAARRRG